MKATLDAEFMHAALVIGAVLDGLTRFEELLLEPALVLLLAGGAMDEVMFPPKAAGVPVPEIVMEVSV